MKLTIRDLKRIIMEEYREVLTDAEDTYNLGDDSRFSFDPDADAEQPAPSRHDQFSELRSLFHDYFYESEEDRIDQDAPSYSKLTRALLVKNLTCALNFTDIKFEQAWDRYSKVLKGMPTSEALTGMTISQPKIRKAREAAGVSGEEYDQFFAYMYEYGTSLDADAPCGARGILYATRFMKAARQKGMGPKDYVTFKKYWDSLQDFQKVTFITSESEPMSDDTPDKLQKSIICPDYEVTDDIENALTNLKYLYSRDPDIILDCDKHFSGTPSGKWRKTGE